LSCLEVAFCGKWRIYVNQFDLTFNFPFDDRIFIFVKSFEDLKVYQKLQPISLKGGTTDTSTFTWKE